MAMEDPRWLATAWDSFCMHQESATTVLFDETHGAGSKDGALLAQSQSLAVAPNGNSDALTLAGGCRGVPMDKDHPLACPR